MSGYQIQSLDKVSVIYTAYWIAQRAIKIVYDHVDGLQPSPHDITVVQDQMNSYFKVGM